MKPYHQLIKHKGNYDLFKGIHLSIAALGNGIPLHIHAEGVRGTGKTTLMRSIKEKLLPILRVKDCVYNCHPEFPHCPLHRHLSVEEVIKIGTEWVPCPFLEISHAAKVGTVIGSIDLSKLTQEQAIAAILPGTIPKAHRGIIFIDEINRLADTSPELADLLLDVMGSKPGHIQIEETGLPTVELPVSVSIWAASNPDEEPGPLHLIRKQLSDRFDFTIDIERPKDYATVFTILEQSREPISLQLAYQSKQQIGDLSKVENGDFIRKMIAKIYVDFNLESLRSVETMELAVRLSCLMEGRQISEVSDLINIVPLALNRRVEKESIKQIIKELEGQSFTTTAVSKIQNLASTENIVKMNWWKKILDALCNKIKFLNKYKKPMSYPMAGSNHDGLPAGNLKILDPSKVNITSPSRKALSIRELPVEDFIKQGEK